MERLRQLIHEIHRRSLWQVLGIYLGSSWFVFEAIKGVVETAGLPDWVPAFALILFLIGLPVVMATAFVQEGIGPAVAKPSETAQESSAVSPFAGGIFTWRNAIGGGVLAFGFWGIVVTGWLVLQRGETPRAESRVQGSAPSPTGGQAASSQSAAAAVGRLRITSDPAGASVKATRVDRTPGNESPVPASELIELGTSPVDTVLPEGEYLISVSSESSFEVTFIGSVSAHTSFHRAVGLVPSSPLNEGMLHVRAGVLAFDTEGTPVPAFLIHRFEVTNADFARFVSGGAYADGRLWPDSVTVGSATVTRNEVPRHFVDRTRLPGPRHWSGSVYPEGEGSHPVVEVSWYEADAYCRWVQKRLPTWREWWRAAVDDLDQSFPWGEDGARIDARANFGTRRTTPVGSFPLGVSPFGLYDVAGNAEEWVDVAQPGDEQALTAGGSWNDPVYTFEPGFRDQFPLGFDHSTLGFRCAREIG